MIDTKTWLVAQREVTENIRTKAFWIGILIFPVILVASILVPTWLEKNKSAREYAVIDHSGWLLEAVDQRAALPDLEKVFRHAMELSQAEDPEFDALPEKLRQTTAQLEMAIPMLQAQQPEMEEDELEDKIVEGFAATISGLSGPRGEMLRQYIPPEAMAELEQLRDSVRDWWQALPAEESKKFGGAITKSRYVRVDPPEGESPEAVIEQLETLVEDEDLFAYFVIDEDPINETRSVRYVSANLTDEDLRRWFGNLASEAVREQRLQEKEIDPQVAQWVQQKVEFEVRKPGAAEEEVGEQDRVRQWAPVAFVYLLWIAIFSIAQMLLTNTVEEKSNRIMEVLLSSISPLQLMVGKILGIALTGLAMVVSWVFFFYVSVKFLPTLTGEEMTVDLSAIAADPFYLVSFVAYFVLGYLFYAALLVAVGSVCNSLKEAQNLQSPIMILLMIPLFSMVPIAQDPNGPLAKLLSFVPPFTPFVMMNRAAGPPAVWEYVATTALLAVSLLAVMWAAAKVFRIGILMTGKPPKAAEILRWIKAPVGAVPEREDLK
jgi:ABC-2 type transport system permease protein